MLYLEMADRLQTQIAAGLFPVGSRLPGVRKLSIQQEVSIATAVSACRELEQRGVLEARPRSGYFVRQPPAQRDMPRKASTSHAQSPDRSAYCSYSRPSTIPGLSIWAPPYQTLIFYLRGRWNRLFITYSRPSAGAVQVTNSHLVHLSCVSRLRAGWRVCNVWLTLTMYWSPTAVRNPLPSP